MPVASRLVFPSPLLHWVCSKSIVCVCIYISVILICLHRAVTDLLGCGLSCASVVDVHVC